MRILIPSIQTPFINGGAQLMTQGLKKALIKHGHEVEIVTIPFKFSPESYIEDLIDIWKEQDFSNFNGFHIDKVIILQFPAYYVKHNNKTLWLMHQHRVVYELYDQKIATDSFNQLRKKIIQNDTDELSKITNRYSMCQNVSNRLKKYNGLDSIPVYHPPFGEENFYCDESYDYIICPSRLETLKRQDLLIKAMQFTKSPIVAVIAGVGGQYETYKKLIEDLNVSDKITLLGSFSDEEKYVLYARSLAVFFAPFDEDYGYITLEAMLSSKPVITCKDSGGPLEFLEDEINGFIIEPNPELIARKLDWLYNNKNKASEMGKNGLESYKNKNISWDNVVQKLLED